MFIFCTTNSRMSKQYLKAKQAELSRLMKEINSQLQSNNSPDDIDPDDALLEFANPDEGPLTRHGYENDGFVIEDDVEDDDEADMMDNEDGGEDEDQDVQDDEDQDANDEQPEQDQDQEDEQEDVQPKRLKSSKVFEFILSCANDTYIDTAYQASTSQLPDDEASDPEMHSDYSNQKRKEIVKGKQRAKDPEPVKESSMQITKQRYLVCYFLIRPSNTHMTLTDFLTRETSIAGMIGICPLLPIYCV